MLYIRWMVCDSEEAKRRLINVTRAQFASGSNQQQQQQKIF